MNEWPRTLFGLILYVCCTHVYGDSLGNILDTSERMYADDGDRLESSLSRYKLQVQTDGNLVAREISSGSAFWSTDTHNQGTSGYYLTMQGDCNLVLYDGDKISLWSSKTSSSGYDNCYLKIRDDRNIVIYSGNDDIVWESDTALSS